MLIEYRSPGEFKMTKPEPKDKIIIIRFNDKLFNQSNRIEMTPNISKWQPPIDK